MELMDILQLNQIHRIRYDGSFEDGPPNNHCCWDDDYGYWMENDEHLRNRIKDQRGIK